MRGLRFETRSARRSPLTHAVALDTEGTELCVLCRLELLDGMIKISVDAEPTCETCARRKRALAL